VNRANEMGCISDGLYFSPDAHMQYAELYKIAACVTGLTGSTQPLSSAVEGAYMVL
jgi:hypothetical protein